MHSELGIEINVPRQRVFEVASDLERWPTFLPHYIKNTFIEGNVDDGIVTMSCRRPPLVLTWTSIYRRDHGNFQMYFKHLKPITRGMVVIWELEPTDSGTSITIKHDLTIPWPVIGRFVSDILIQRISIDYVAPRTLKHLKTHLENQAA
jgi:ribosome-associated toxin RatA of RatAB toxin-antitoxin module